MAKTKIIKIILNGLMFWVLMVIQRPLVAAFSAHLAALS